MKIEPIEGSETSAFKTQTPGKYPKENILQWVPFFPGIKRPGRGVDHPPRSTVEVKERIQLCLYSHSGPSCCSRVNFTLLLLI